MNTQIQKLAEQAGIWQPTFDHKTWVRGEYVASLGELEKFAELIVRECVEKCKTDWYGDSLDDICKQMKEHFGVEE